MKILLVDDEPIVLNFSGVVLKRAGYEVIEAKSGEDALQLCRDLGSTLDLVITDVSMPGISGRDLADCIRELPKPIPLILMSGYTSNSPSVVHLVQDGKLDGVPFLQKPFTHIDLIAIVSATLSKKQ